MLPKMLNLPEDKTVLGKERKKHRRFNKDELIYLLSPDNIKLAETNQLYVVRHNFEAKFNWKPMTYSIRVFYEKKTYPWAWDGKMANIPEILKENHRNKNINNYSDLIESLIKKGLLKYKDFCEELKKSNPSLMISPGTFYKFKKKMGMINTRTEKNTKAISLAQIVKERIKDFDTKDNNASLSVFNYIRAKHNELTTTIFNHIASKNGFCLITKEQVKSIHENDIKNKISISGIDIHYSYSGYCLIESLDWKLNKNQLKISKEESEIIKNIILQNLKNKYICEK